MLGANYLGSGRCEFTVWAPYSRSVIVKITNPLEREIPLTARDKGYWRAVAENIEPGSRDVYSITNIG